MTLFTLIVKEFKIFIYQIVGPVPKLVEFSLKKAKSSNKHCCQMYVTSQVILYYCSYIVWYHGTVSVYLSTDFSFDLLNMNATGTASVGNIKGEDTVVPSNMETPLQVNKNYNSFNWHVHEITDSTLWDYTHGLFEPFKIQKSSYRFSVLCS